jgi:hypothetical protein
LKNGESVVDPAKTIKSTYNRLAIMDERKQAFTFLDICLILAVIISIFILPVIIHLLY